MKEMKEQGVEIVDVDKALFEEAVKPVVDKFLSDASVEFQVSPALKTLLKLRGVIRTDVCRGPLRPLKEDEKRILEEIYAAYCEEEGIHE